MHFSDYESDQSRLYNAHHNDINSAESKSKVKNIWKITAYLTLITLIEVGIGLYSHYSHADGGLKTAYNIIFILMTLLKAGLIVSIFMHLGDEVKSMIMMILIPLTLFIWFTIAFIADGAFWLWINQHVYTWSK
jgi:cytochrome c oxidase subunit IV